MREVKISFYQEHLSNTSLLVQRIYQALEINCKKDTFHCYLGAHSVGFNLKKEEEENKENKNDLKGLSDNLKSLTYG